MLYPVYHGIRVMMLNQIDYAFEPLLRDARVSQKFPYKGAALFFLVLPVSIAVFLTAKRAGYIVSNSSCLYYELAPVIQLFDFTYRLGIRPDFMK